MMLVELWALFARDAAALSVLMSLAAVVVSVIALRRSGPRVTVTLSKGWFLPDGESEWSGKAFLRVDVTNDGARPTLVQSADFVSPVGSVRGRTLGKDRSPHQLEAHGGRQSWFVDRQDLQRLIRQDGSDQPAQFRALVRSGRRQYMSKTVEMVNPSDGVAVVHERVSVRRRIPRWLNGWTRPRLEFTGFTRGIRDIDLAGGRVRIAVRNAGGGVARGARLELMEDIDDGRRRIGDPVPIPAVWRGRTVYVAVPMVDRDDLTWWIRRKGRAAVVGRGAITRASAAAVHAQLLSVTESRESAHEEERPS